jgi:O-acetylserine/cysteine efflux transporter
MPLKDWLAALIVITAWGVNFVVIKIALDEVPPLLLGALRFSVVAFPAILFVRRPKVPWRTVILYGLTISLGQFVFLFSAMAAGMPAGLASLVLQSQAFFTVLIAALVLGERVQRHNVLGMVVAIAGLFLIAKGAPAGSVPLLAFFLTLVAALSWATGNIVAKGAGKQDMLGLVVWGALIPPLPFLALSAIIESPATMQSALAHMSYVGVSAVLYLALVATIIGYVLWGRLLVRHPVSQVAPLSLLVPVIGLVSSAWLLDERMDWVQWIGGAIVMLGLTVNVFGPRLRRLLPGV